ncbi:HYR domain-containing protein [Mariniphaga sp.]|uniref:HYR domain-containing protein n=1 Tax=Mariniphaga sp. TaxID=1954475 RepID=UPI003567538A
MKKFYLFFLSMLFSATTLFSQTLTYTIELRDIFGDGWNGGTIDVLIDGNLVLDNITLSSDAGPAVFTFSVNPGNTITTNFVPGTYFAHECEYVIKNEEGVVVAQSGQGGVTPGNITYSVPGHFCPDDIEVDNDPGVCGAVVNYTVIASEKGSAVQTGGLPSGSEFPIGTTMNTFLLTDSLGVETTCSFSVIVNDTEPPLLDCPENIVVSNDPGECGAVVTFSTLADEVLLDEVLPASLSEWEVYDHYNNPIFNYEEITSPYDGSTAIKTSVVGNTYSWCSTESLTKIYDINGNTKTTDLQAYMEFASNLTTYNFPYLTVELFDENNQSLGQHVYYGKDMVGSWFLTTYILTNPDSYTELPSATGDMILDLAEVGENIDFSKISIKLANYTCIGENSIIFDHLRVLNGSIDDGTENTGVVASDNCPGTQVEATISSGSFFPIGTTPVTLTATDAAGNETSCTFNVTVEDTEAPFAVCGSNGTGKSVLLLWDIDNANTQSLKTAIEASGFTVTLPTVPEYQWDGTNPSLDGFDAVVHLNGSTFSFGLPLSAQNALLDFVQVQGKLFVHSEWDAYELDEYPTHPALAPIVILQRNSGYETAITYNTVPGYDTHPVLDGIPSSFIIDFAGHNVGQVRQYDTYPAETLMLDHDGNAAVAVRELEKGKVVGFGHAGNYASSNSLSNVNVQKLFVNALKWGTTSTGDFEFVLDETGTVTITPEDIDQGSTDNCGIESMELSQTDFTWNDLGTQEVILTVTDLAGNSSSCIANITITGGNQEPVVVANPIDVYLDETGKYWLTREDLEKMTEGTTDESTAFEELKINAYPHIFSCDQVFDEVIHTRLSVEDAQGNISRAWTTVTVHDTLPPTFVAVDDIEVVLEPGLAESAIEYPAIEVLDNCTLVPELIEGLGPDGIFPAGTTTETWTVEDGGGNTTTLSFSVTIITTNDLPTIDPIENITANEDDPPVMVQLTGISYGNDAEEQTVTLTAENDNPELVTSIAVNYTSGNTGSLEIELAPEMSGDAIITIKVEDSEGGIVTESFTLTVNSVNDAPFVVNPISDQVVNASYGLKVPVSKVLGELFDDIDGDALTVSAMLKNGDPLPAWAEMMNDSLVFSPMIEDTGCVHIVVMATDPDGAAAADTFQLCVDGYPVNSGQIAFTDFNVNMYPNPARDWVNLEVKNVGVGAAEVTVYTITGQQIIHRKFTNNQNISFNMEYQVSGMYFVKLNIEGKEAVKKLVLDRK